MQVHAPLGVTSLVKRGVYAIWDFTCFPMPSEVRFITFTKDESSKKKKGLMECSGIPAGTTCSY